MRDMVVSWLGQEVYVSYLAATVVDGYSGFHDQRGVLKKVDGMGLLLETASGYMAPAVRDHETGNIVSSGKWVPQIETACIPWSAIAKVSRTVTGTPVADEED